MMQPAVAAAAPGNPLPVPQIVASLLAVTEALARLVIEENKRLEARRPRDIEPLQEEKQTLTLAYGRELAQLRASPDWPARISAADRERLRDATRLFEAAVGENRRRLSAMRTISDGIIKAIGDAAARLSRPVQGYTARAAMAAAGVRSVSAPRPVSISLNQRV